MHPCICYACIRFELNSSECADSLHQLHGSRVQEQTTIIDQWSTRTCQRALFTCEGCHVLVPSLGQHYCAHVSGRSHAKPLYFCGFLRTWQNVSVKSPRSFLWGGPIWEIELSHLQSNVWYHPGWDDNKKELVSRASTRVAILCRNHVTYFDRVTAFKALYLWTSITGGVHTRCIAAATMFKALYCRNYTLGVCEPRP